MSPKKRRLTAVLVGLAALGTAAGLALSALNDNIVFFYGPSELAKLEEVPQSSIRVGGLVQKGSLERSEDGNTIRFTITDGVETVPVVYSGLLPDLFREGQGVVAEGRIRNGRFRAENILAKHDEEYMPPEVAEALKKAGEWKKGQTGQAQTTGQTQTGQAVQP